ncbi:MAG TPA: lysylphosphatidylglycerol synthase transmembrane domain-containing protein [Anaerolineae bacterium]|nr:lysylphosphatidylglycerol synthase transmembrane domain-containing protein [Anaerolineae bacterium]HNU03130.1 lysylphosphatidylglycerol synthase transmembrane domain-containing protein [Anaerolineae bacterium]
MKKRWRTLLGFGISAFFLYFALRGLDLREVRYWLSQATYYWLIPAVAIYFVGVWVRTWRWHYMLRPIKPITTKRLFPIVCIGYMGNNIFPLRAGEVLRAYVLKRSEDVSMSSSLATIVVERVFDGLVMLMFVFFAIPFAPMPANLRPIVILPSLFFLALLVVFVLLATKPDLAQQLYRGTVRRVLPANLRLKTDGFIERFLEGLHFFRSSRDILMVFLISVVIWLAETMKYWFVMQAFVQFGAGLPVAFYVLMLMNGIVNLATTLPSAPGYIGTFDTPGIEVLSAYGVSRSLAAGYTLVLHAALWFPITILGAWYFRRERLTWSDVDAARQQRAQAAELT